jgi:hypothetical protein
VASLHKRDLTSERRLYNFLRGYCVISVLRLLFCILLSIINNFWMNKRTSRCNMSAFKKIKIKAMFKILIKMKQNGNNQL